MKTIAQIDKYKLNIYCDENTESPREWGTMVGNMVCWHHRYGLGDKHNFSSPDDFKQSDDYKNAYIILPLYLYDHSILKISNESFIGRAQHAEWDSGQVGYVYITKDDVKELTGYEPIEENKHIIAELLKAETELYDDYLEGNCYGYSIEDLSGDTIDLCGGFYGSDLNKVLTQMQEQAGEEFEPLFAKAQAYERTLHNVMT